MGIVKLLASAAAGFIIFLLAVVYVGGIAMAVPIPASYYAVFRPMGGGAPALALVSLLVWGLPVAIVAGVGFFVMLRVLRTPLALLFVCGVAGMVVAHLMLTDFQVFNEAPFVLWGIPHVLAPWLGALAAFLLSRRGSVSRAEPVA